MLTLSGVRTAVTGGAGFIGSHLVDHLLAAGNEVVVIDDFSSGSRRNLAPHASDPRLHIVTASVVDFGALKQALDGVQYVFHLATRNVRLSLRQPTLVHEVNVGGTYNVLRAATAQGVRRLLYCSSSEVYGSATRVPLPEDCELRPQTVYGASKLAGEYYAQVFHRSGWLETVVARPHNTYGPRGQYAFDRGEVIPRWIVRALAGLPPVIFGDGAQTRDFTYVEETARYLAALIATELAGGGIFNICRGKEVAISDVARTISRLTGLDLPHLELPPRPYDVRRLHGDPSRLRSLLGCSPAISIDEGLEITVAWFRHNVLLTDEVLAQTQAENWSDIAAESWLKR